MQEIFEKIKERLEEKEKASHERALEEIMNNGHSIDAEHLLSQEDTYCKAIEIVNQVAEEYDNGWIPCSGCSDCKHTECEWHGKI